MLSVDELVHKALHARLSPHEIETAVDYYWSTNDFIRTVSNFAVLNYTTAPLATLARYANHSPIRSQLLYGADNLPGCVIIDAPPEIYPTNLDKLHVPPHTHNTAHIAILLAGGGQFVVGDASRKSLPQHVQVKPGNVLFYPGGTIHTFIAGAQGLRVASVQANFISPQSPAFAHYV